jgi:tetratricopeptide (TPR) repeat protein
LDVGAKYPQKGLETARLAGNLQQEINATLRLSTNAYMTGDAAAAERLAREALDTARSHQLNAMAIRGLLSLGNAYLRKRDSGQAERYFSEALNLSRQTRNGHLTAVSLLSLASISTRDREQRVRDAQEALPFYQANRYAKESGQCLTIIARAKRDA